MNAVAMIHPEDLLDRARQGALDAAGRATLDAHLKMCAACRFEVAVSADFARESSAAVDTDALIRNALALQPRPSKRRAVYARAAVIAAVCLMGAAATASPLGQQAIAVVSSAIRSALRTEPKPMPAPVPEEVRAPAMPALETKPAVETKTEEAKSGKKPIAAAVPTTATIAKAAAVDEQTTEPPAVLATASELLTQALAARRENRVEEARAAYADLITRFPASPEATLAFVALGRLELDANHAQAALDLFDRYLAAPGALEEEALAGKARALSKLSRASDESAAWQRLLERFPASIHEQRALQRLHELGEP